MIQDIAPHRLDNHFRPGQNPEKEDTVFHFSGEKVLCRVEEDGIHFPHFGELTKENGHPSGKSPRSVLSLSAASPGREAIPYLFDLDGTHYFLSLREAVPIPDGFGYTAIRSLRRRRAPQRHLIFAAVTARHLNDWYRSARFCGRCGQRMVHSETERAMVCPACGRVFYPRINPAVIIGVTNGDQLLLTKYAGRDVPYYALVAGFTEIGESFEETVRREVREETGLEITNIRYYKSQPWGFAADILAGYYCDVVGDPTIHMDPGELKEALWVPRTQITGQPDDFSLTNEMLLAFAADQTTSRPDNLLKDTCSAR